MSINKLFGTAVVMLLFSLSTYSHAASSEPESDTACPVGLVSGLTLTTEFGPYVAANTRCNRVRHDVKTMFAIDKTYANGVDSTNGPYALNQMQNVLNDYTITDGMSPSDFSMIAIVHSAGGFLLLNNPAYNPYIDKVKKLMSEGVTFYFCENTVRGFIKHGFLTGGEVGAGVIPGTKFVTAGLSAVSDFQALGYHYDQP